jgi:hypothetical protein
MSLPLGSVYGRYQLKGIYITTVVGLGQAIGSDRAKGERDLLVQFTLTPRSKDRKNSAMLHFFETAQES